MSILSRLVWALIAWSAVFIVWIGICPRAKLGLTVVFSVELQVKAVDILMQGKNNGAAADIAIFNIVLITRVDNGFEALATVWAANLLR
jgi:hypothetical protein